MFDQLIESDTVGADFKSRRRYFLVSTVVVGVLFVSAVVFSIYASEIGLGNGTYELTALLTPVQPPADAPEPPQPRQQRRTNVENSADLPTRVIQQQPIDVPPKEIPSVSTIPNRYLSIPNEPYRVGPNDTPGPSGPIATGPETGSSQPAVNDTAVNNIEKVGPPKADPPPLIEKPKPPRSIGVANGYATYLPKPDYPRPALAMGVEGKVDVQITIDEFGKVVSAKAVSGHPFFRQVAERAAMGAKFKPTTLSNVPVKVTGIIVYNFTRN